MQRFWDKVNKTDDCWLWTAGTSSGYGTIRGLDQKSVGAHRLSWELAHGPIPDDLQVLHECDNKLCVRPSHLFLGTQLDNMRDMVAKGRHARSGAGDQTGANNNGSKLAVETVRRIKRLNLRGVPQAEIARKTGATKANVWAIVHGLSWQET